MGAVRLGKLYLHWCPNCNVPVLGNLCGACNGSAYEIKVTPPGDIRPAFRFDILRIREIIDWQFGNDCGQLMLPDEHVVVLNRCPALERMEEFIVDGRVCGAIVFYPDMRKVLLRPDGAHRILTALKKNWVMADAGAVASVLDGCNLMAPGVTAVAEGLEPGAETIVLGQKNELIAIGTAKMTKNEIMTRREGVAVKVRHRVRPEITISEHKMSSASWDKVINANRIYLDEMISAAVKFIRETAARAPRREIAVSYSGGKDSLATLGLVLDAGLTPSILFIDTGLEFPETIENVREVSELFSLRVLTCKPEREFWALLPFFGPPARDFRWCCKTCKLGPATKLIGTNFPNGVLAFIGQRRYESVQRARKGQVWKNPWVPGQLGASPIQNWSALHVWLYIFMKKLPYNPLYERGLERIGCWLCPASDISELETVSSHHPDEQRWANALREYAARMGYSDEWDRLALWRWKILPEGIRSFIRERGIEISGNPRAESSVTEPQFISVSGFLPCAEGITAEGTFNFPLQIGLVANRLSALGSVRLDPETDSCSLNDGSVTIFGPGLVFVKGRSKPEVEKRLRAVRELVLRVIKCVGCGICAGRCKKNAIVVNESARIIEEKCVHCGDCMKGPCPVISYKTEKELEF